MSTTISAVAAFLLAVGVLGLASCIERSNGTTPTHRAGTP